MTGWSVRARFVGSADEESKVSTSKVESPWIRCLPVTRDTRQPPTSNLQPPSGHDKAMAAWLVRKRTSVTRDWVTERLVMGHPSSVSRAVRKVREEPKLGRKAKRLEKAID